MPATPAIRDEDVILHGFYRNARERPDAPYLTQPLGKGAVDEFTFARALDEAKRVAAYLRSLQLPPQSRIAVLSKNCAHVVVADLAIWMAGHVSVLVFSTFDPPTVRYVLEHSESRLLFVGKLDGWEETRTGLPEGLPCVAFPLAPETAYLRWSAVLEAHAPIADEPRRRPEDLATIIYTSGSTGRPKGVVHSFATMSAPTQGIVKTFGFGPADRYLSYLPLAHGMERWVGECMPMVAGVHVYFAESVETFVDDLRRARPTAFLSVPRLWLKFQQGVHAKLPPRKLDRLLRIPVVSRLVKRRVLEGLGLDQVRIAASGSAPIPPELLGWYRRLGLELIEGYGMTENFNYSHLNRVGEVWPGSVGYAHPGVECRLGEDGEVLVKSPGTMLGYFKEPDLTRAAFTDDGFLRTGDQGAIDGGGRLRITGRVKEIFKTSKGKYVAPAPIENLLCASGLLEQACVAGAGRPAPHAVVQLAEHLQAAAAADPEARAATTRALEELLRSVNDQLVAYERLAFVAVVRQRWTAEGGLLTPSMKIKRGPLEKRYAPALDAWYESGQRVIWEG